MRLNCGLTTYDKRELKAFQLQKEAEELRLWHRVYAWLPIRVQNPGNPATTPDTITAPATTCVWFEWVWRRYENIDVRQYHNHVLPPYLLSDKGPVFRAIDDPAVVPGTDQLRETP